MCVWVDVLFKPGKVLYAWVWYLESVRTFTAILSISHNVEEQFRTFTVSSSSVHYLKPMFTRCWRLYTFVSALFVWNSHFSIYKNWPLRVTTVPDHHLYHTSDFCRAPKQFSVTTDAGLESPVPINTLWCCLTNQCYTRSTPSHIVISVADLEVKFNFPLQQQPSPYFLLLAQTGYYNLWKRIYGARDAHKKTGNLRR